MHWLKFDERTYKIMTRIELSALKGIKESLIGSKNARRMEQRTKKLTVVKLIWMLYGGFPEVIIDACFFRN